MQRLKENTISTRSTALYRYFHLNCIQIKLYFEPINIIEVIEVTAVASNRPTEALALVISLAFVVYST